MNDELKHTWKESVAVQSRHYSGACLKGIRKITKTVVMTPGESAKIRTQPTPLPLGPSVGTGTLSTNYNDTGIEMQINVEDARNAQFAQTLNLSR